MEQGQSTPAVIKIVYKVGSENKLLKQFTQTEWDQLQKKKMKEKNTQWEGIFLNDLLEQCMESLPLREKANVDLVILKNHDKRALVPRFLATKYKLMLSQKSGKFYSIIPFETQPKIKKEILPLETYEVAEVSEIILANYQAQYKKAHLDNRSNPIAVRGEKLFVKACMGCHDQSLTGSIQDVTSRIPNFDYLTEPPHPPVQGMPKISDAELKGFKSYIKALKDQNPSLFEI